MAKQTTRTKLGVDDIDVEAVKTAMNLSSATTGIAARVPVQRLPETGDSPDILYWNGPFMFTKQPVNGVNCLGAQYKIMRGNTQVLAQTSVWQQVNRAVFAMSEADRNGEWELYVYVDADNDAARAELIISYKEAIENTALPAAQFDFSAPLLANVTEFSPPDPDRNSWMDIPLGAAAIPQGITVYYWMVALLPTPLGYYADFRARDNGTGGYILHNQSDNGALTIYNASGVEVSYQNLIIDDLYLVKMVMGAQEANGLVTLINRYSHDNRTTGRRINKVIVYLGQHDTTVKSAATLPQNPYRYYVLPATIATGQNPVADLSGNNVAATIASILV